MQLSLIKGQIMVVVGKIVQREGIDLFHWAKDTQLDFTSPYFSLHSFAHSHYDQLLPPVHQHIVISYGFIPLLWPVSPPQHFHVKHSYLKSFLAPSVGEFNHQVTSLTNSLKKPFVFKEFKMLCSFVSYGPNVLELPTQLSVNFGVYFLVGYVVSKPEKELVHWVNSSGLHYQIINHLFVPSTTTNCSVQNLVKDLFMQFLELFSMSAIDIS